MALLLGTACVASAAASPLRVDQDGDGWVLHADVELAADVAVVWGTITDYDQLPRFVPGIESSRVLARRPDGAGERLTIEQSGVLRFWFFAQPVRVRLDVHHDPQRAVDARMIPPVAQAHGTYGEANASRGDDGSDALRAFEGHYRLTRLAPLRMRLVYDARLVPQFDAAWLGGLALRRTAVAQFDALLAEVARRQGCQQGACAPSVQGGASDFGAAERRSGTAPK